MDNYELAKRRIITTQCLAFIGMSIYQNGAMVNYLTKLGQDESFILNFLTIPSLFSLLFILPISYLSDRFGIKKIGTIGLSIGCLVMPCYILASSAEGYVKHFLMLGIILHSLSIASFNSGWLALLGSIVPHEQRGRFLGKLRLSWQTVTIVFSAILTYVLSKNAEVKTYHYLFIFIILVMIFRIIQYWKIKPGKSILASEANKQKPSFKTGVKEVLSNKDYVSYICYLFLLTFFTATTPWLLNLQQKNNFQFSDDKIILLSNTLFIGSMLGYFIGGQISDKINIKKIFIICHLLYGLIFLLFTFREISPFSTIYHVGVLMFLYGLVQSSASIAITKQTLNLIHPEFLSLSTSMIQMITGGATAISGLIISQIIKRKVIASDWKLPWSQMDQYDTIFIGCGIMIFMLVVTLGILPAHKTQKIS